jgi:hypothetical protein
MKSTEIHERIALKSTRTTKDSKHNFRQTINRISHHKRKEVKSKYQHNEKENKNSKKGKIEEQEVIKR